MFEVTFITAAPYCAEVVETHKTIDDAKLRASALGWQIKKIDMV